MQFKYLLIPLILLLICSSCYLIQERSGYERHQYNKDFADKTRVGLLKVCTNNDLVEELKNSACRNYRKEGGYNGKNYGEGANDPFTQLNHYISRLFYIGDNKDLIIYSTTTHGWPGEVNTTFDIQYKNKFVTSLNDFSDIYASEDDSITSTENEDSIFFYIYNKSISPNGVVYKFSKLEKKLIDHYYSLRGVSVISYAQTVTSGSNVYPIFDNVNLDIVNFKIIFLKDNIIVGEQVFGLI